MRKQNKIKTNNGITLITLVITIIVLLILAGVAIATLTGDNDLLQKTTTAKQENVEAKEFELIKLAVSAAQVAGEGIITEENLNNELKKNFNNDETVTESSNYYGYKKGKSYRIYKDGKVEEGNLLPDEYQEVEYIESTGTQYIDTKYYSNLETRVIVEFSYKKSNNDGYSHGFVFGSANDTSGKPGLSIGINTDDSFYYRNSDTSQSFKSSFSIEKNTRYYVNIYKNP